MAWGSAASVRGWALAGLTVCSLLGAACHSDRAASSITVDWDAMYRIESGPSGYLNVHELAQRSGLTLALPSYLPDGMTKYLARWQQYASADDQSFRASVVILEGEASESPLEIRITEWQRQEDDAPQGLGSPYQESTSIGGVAVSCQLDLPSHAMTPPPPVARIIVLTPRPGDSMHAGMFCIWDTEELHVDVSFSWTLHWLEESPITDEEVRRESMEVVTSMIEDPYVP